jgi:hypothetical protein
MSIDLSLFDNRAYPNNLPLVDPGKKGYGDEYDEVVRFYTGKSRSDITADSLVNGYRRDYTVSHHFMSSQAFNFFLPALMKVGLDNYLGDTRNIPLIADSLVNSLYRMAKGEMDYRLLPLLGSYTKKQLGEITKFLKQMYEIEYKYLDELDYASKALDLFWNQFDETTGTNEID